MSIKKRFIFYFTVIFLVVAVVSGYSIWLSSSIYKYFNNQLPQAVAKVQESSKLDVIAQLIRYDDEVLTQSARNYAFTGDKKWRDRYDEFAPKLDMRIKEALDRGDAEDKQIFSAIDEANLVLIKIEKESLDYAAARNFALAQKVLNGQEYSKQKAIYKSGIDKYLARRGANFDSATAVSVGEIDKARLVLLFDLRIQLSLIIGFVFLFFFILLFLLFLIVKTFMIPLGTFKEVARNIVGGDLNAVVEIENKDEIGDFAVDFNQMTASLRDSIQNTEQKVKDRTAELERANKLMVGRELKMVELKKELADLKGHKDHE